MVIVTHEMSFAREIADTIVFMDGGRIREIAAPTDFFTNPQSERARRFIFRH
ncbi:amino acid ABC transporter ATP-binding protein, partial [Methylobacterium fujisawaense]